MVYHSIFTVSVNKGALLPSTTLATSNCCIASGIAKDVLTEGLKCVKCAVVSGPLPCRYLYRMKGVFPVERRIVDVDIISSEVRENSSI